MIPGIRIHVKPNQSEMVKAKMYFNGANDVFVDDYQWFHSHYVWGVFGKAKDAENAMNDINNYLR